MANTKEILNDILNTVNINNTSLGTLFDKINIANENFKKIQAELNLQNDTLTQRGTNQIEQHAKDMEELNAIAGNIKNALVSTDEGISKIDGITFGGRRSLKKKENTAENIPTLNHAN